MKKTLTLLALALLFIGCSKDDDDDSEKKVFESSIRQTQLVNTGDIAIRIFDEYPDKLNPVACQPYCPNPTHQKTKYALVFGNEGSQPSIFCQRCGAWFSLNGAPFDDSTKELKLKIKMYNVKYDESLKAYIVW